MREVSYSPLMAAYLTFLDNKAMAYSGSYPDENYAREIMQLFSVGLWKLHRNGTYVLDAQGSPLVTYTTDDVVTLSRAWTGFTRQAARTNLENYYGNTLVSKYWCLAFYTSCGLYAYYAVHCTYCTY